MTQCSICCRKELGAYGSGVNQCWDFCVVFEPLHFTIFEANPRPLTSCCILLNFVSYVGKEYHIKKFREILKIRGGLIDLATFCLGFVRTGSYQLSCLATQLVNCHYE